MKKRAFLSVITALMMVFLVMPSTALAASDTIASGGTYDISTYWNDADGLTDTLTIDTTEAVTLTNTGSITATNFKIVCIEGVDLTLSNIVIDDSANPNVCPLLFTDMGNTLTLASGTTSTLTGGLNTPGVWVGSVTILEIGGDGTLNVTGGSGGAGIGGGAFGNGGIIKILGAVNVAATGGGHGAGIGGGYNGDGGGLFISGTAHVTATGADYGAGIGGGDEGDGGTASISENADVTANGGNYSAGIGGGRYGGGGDITLAGGTVTANGGGFAAGIGSGGEAAAGTTTSIYITAGDVTATGGSDPGDGMGGAGIGSGYGSAAATVQIFEGSVTAQGGGNSAGIGGGQESSAGTITITGGTVTATGDDGGAGIGSGFTFMDEGSAGTIEITGGIVYADGQVWGDDIGNGQNGSGGSLGISGGAAVFMAHDSVLSPVTTTTHTHFTYTADTEEEYGISIPSAWVPTFGSYLRLHTLSYDANGGSGTAPASVTQLYKTKTNVEDGTGISRTDYVFGSWNTASDGSGSTYAPDEEFTFLADKTLYAQWIPLYTLSYDINGGSGTVPASVTQLYNTSTNTVNGTGISRTDYEFGGWNTAADGSGTAYAAGEIFVFTADTTLYAQWIPLYTLSYDVNGGSGTVPASVTQLYNTTTNAADGTGISRTYYLFNGWNTAADGSGTAYAAGAAFTFTADTTLYAQWLAQPELTSSVADGTIYVGGRITLTPNIAGGTWSFDGDYLSREDITFTGLKAGTVTVTYTVEGQSATYDVTIEESELPLTGQDFTWGWVLCCAALMLAAVGLIALKRKTVREK